MFDVGLFGVASLEVLTFAEGLALYTPCPSWFTQSGGSSLDGRREGREGIWYAICSRKAGRLPLEVFSSFGGLTELAVEEESDCD